MVSHNSKIIRFIIYNSYKNALEILSFKMQSFNICNRIVLSTITIVL